MSIEGHGQRRGSVEGGGASLLGVLRTLFWVIVV